jgi:hypothetical protein
MNDISTSQTTTTGLLPQEGAPVNNLRREYDDQCSLFCAQSALSRHFLEGQAVLVAEALIQHLPQFNFELPEQVFIFHSSRATGQRYTVPTEFRHRVVGSRLGMFARTGPRQSLSGHLAALEHNAHPAVAASAGLIRHAVAVHLIHNLLPAGHSVVYVPAAGEEIPTLPVKRIGELDSALTLASDASFTGLDESGHGEVHVPYVPDARRFYLPQWVAFDDQGRLVVQSLNEAEACVAAMQRFVEILHRAAALAPYITADETYQQKRYGMLGQLVNQGRALALYTTATMAGMIRQRCTANELNRGLSLRLPYFDDQSLTMRTLHFQVVPPARIVFLPAFLTFAAREEQVKAAQDTRLSIGTRRHLIGGLRILEQSFLPRAGE